MKIKKKTTNQSVKINDMNVITSIRMFFLDKLDDLWVKDSDENKARAFNYIVAVCMRTELDLGCEMIKRSYETPLNRTRVEQKARLLDYYRSCFVTEEVRVASTIYFKDEFEPLVKDHSHRGFEFALGYIDENEEMQGLITECTNDEFVERCFDIYLTTKSTEEEVDIWYFIDGEY